MKKRRPLIVGNWKQNPATVSRAEKIWIDLQKNLRGRRGASDVAIAPPVLFVADLKELAGSEKVDFIAQDVSVFDGGAYTGEISAAQLRSVGIKCSLVGHSERREMGESDDVIRQKIQILVENKLAIILCVGEKERDGSGDHFNMVEEQLLSAVTDLNAADIKNLIVAYEPVWAIGTGENATPSDVEEMKLFIHKVLSDRFGREAAEHTRVLYGGSVTGTNAEELLKSGKADGFLVGGASLSAKDFASIIKIADKYALLA